MKTLIEVRCQPCMFCGKRSTVTVSQAAYDNWRAGAHAQHAFPELSDAERGLLISGTCSACFGEAFDDDTGFGGNCDD